MGVGKTTVGTLLADELGRPFLDSDEVLEARNGESGIEIATREGVARLHEFELEAFLLMVDTSEPAVLAPAASVVDHATGRAALEENLAVWLTAPDEVLAQRQGTGGHRRPVSAEEHTSLRRRRAPFLEEVSVMTVDTGTASPAEVVEEVIDRLSGGLISGEGGRR